ncbi:Metallo-peptidase family M12-domain-containing protein [Hysterangium stoloniferum]|nr:Metallo-peptidase family M12-domain-containing protein [Hysterangium stoloniferum]
MLATNATSSPPPRPLKRLAQPSIHALEILPRHPHLHRRSSESSIPPKSPILHHTDSFRLTLSAFDQTYHLHLKPNDDLLHPAARINYYKNGPDGQAVLDRTEPILPNDVKAYVGDVIHADATLDRIREDSAGGRVNSRIKPLGWARIMVHHQGDADLGISPIFEGAFSVNGVVHHVLTQEKFLRTKHPLDPRPTSYDANSDLVIFRDSDIASEAEDTILRHVHGLFSPSDETLPPAPPKGATTCSHDHLSWNTDPDVNPMLQQPEQSTWIEKTFYGGIGFDIDARNKSARKRDDVAGGQMSSTFSDKIGQSAGCPIQQMIVYMGVAADCSYVKKYGSSQNASSAILNDWNLASALYKNTFNISLGILHMDIHDATCPTTTDPAFPWNVDCTTNITLNDRLSIFSQWRGTKGVDGAGLWHLMSGCPTGTEVGVAWLGTLCQSTANGSPGNVVSGTAVSTSGRTEWQVVAHETGHNFGAICVSGCDSSTPCCPLSTSSCDTNSKFVMSPTSDSDEVTFSQCSLGNICSLMAGKQTNSSCIQVPDPNVKTFALQQCGNGILETGEDCDPGSGSNSTCCDAATCKFKSGAVCDFASSACCTGQCQFAPSTQVCRPAQDAGCDIAETCTGTSATCPWDVTQPNGQSCGSGLACASGQCTSLSKQCQTVGSSMGLTAACPNKGDTSCRVSCADPQSNSQCVVLQAQLIDGSPCGFGGKCSGGRCQRGSLLDTIKSWYTSNLQIAIPVTVAAAIILLFILYGLIRCMRHCCRRQRSPIAEPALRAVPAQRLASWTGPPSNMNNTNPYQALPAEQVWVPPAGVMNNGATGNTGSRRVRFSGIPAALRAGSDDSRRTASGRSTNEHAGYGAQGPPGQYPHGTTGYGSQTNPSRANWVDPAAWNGT